MHVNRKWKKRWRDELRVKSNPIRNSSCLIGYFTHELRSVIRAICMILFFSLLSAIAGCSGEYRRLISDDHSAFLTQHFCLTFKNILRAAPVCFWMLNYRFFFFTTASVCFIKVTQHRRFVSLVTLHHRFVSLVTLHHRFVSLVTQHRRFVSLVTLQRRFVSLVTQHRRFVSFVTLHHQFVF